MMSLRSKTVLALAAAAFLSACAKKEEKKSVPAVVENVVKETELTTIRLTPKAETRIGIRTATVGEQYVNGTRTFSGEIVSVPGKTVTLTAPMAGTLTAAGGSLAAGQNVGKGQTLYRLLILPSERDVVSAPEDVTQREIQYRVAQQQAERAARLYAEKAGSLRAKQEAEANVAAARASLRVARARTELLAGNGSTSSLSALAIQAPTSGVVQRVFAAPGQVVAAGAPLAEIAFVSTVWVRVPVYAGDAEGVSRTASAQVGSLSRFSAGAGSYTARPVSGPQTADAASTSVDLFYELDNAGGIFRPGQRVSVALPFGGAQSGLAVPVSALVYDINGGTWVYQTDSPQVYRRTRVEVKSASGDWAMISRGIAAGARIVTVGTAELWGTEFGGGK